VRIHLPSYPRGTHQIVESVSAEQLALDTEVFREPIEAHIKLDRHDPYLEFDISLQTEVISPCDRCLVDYAWTMKCVTPMIYVLGQPPDGEAVDDTGIGYLAPHATDVDLTREIRDAIILSLPGKFLCREDCLGLCPVCGGDRNERECTCTVSATN
jgi:uncharacterized protein